MTTHPTTPTLRLLSLGAGIQSTALLLLAAEGRLPGLDGAIFSDTGWEPAAVYHHLDRLETEVAQPAGIPIYRVSAGRIQDDVLNPDKQRSLPAHTRDPETGDHGMLNRRCTQTYKLTPIMRKTRLLLGAATSDPTPCRYCDGTGTRIAPWRAKLNDHTPGPCSVCDGTGTLARVGQPPRDTWAEQWVGFSTDEIGRVSTRADTRYAKSRHPLLDLGMSRTQCEAYLKSRGWGEAAKSACIGCPFHGNAEWRRMRDTDPQSWAEAVRFDKAYRTGPGLRHERFLHISRRPLDEAPIDRIRPSEWKQDDFFDAVYDAELAENGDPDGCSPYACRSGSAAAGAHHPSPRIRCAHTDVLYGQCVRYLDDHDGDCQHEHQPTPAAPAAPEETTWAGATELASDREIARVAATGIVGYRQGQGRLLHCLAHKPAPASRWADFHEVGADDLDDGGNCAYPRCGRDLLAAWPAAPEETR